NELKRSRFRPNFSPRGAGNGRPASFLVCFFAFFASSLACAVAIQLSGATMAVVASDPASTETATLLSHAFRFISMFLQRLRRVGFRCRTLALQGDPL